MAQRREAERGEPQHLGRAIAVLHVCALKDENQHQADGVGQDVTLAALGFLACVEPANPSSSQLAATSRWLSAYQSH